MILAAAEYPFLEIVGTIIIFFAWVAWFWTVIAVLGHMFRRPDLSGGAKAGWTLLIVVVPFLGVLLYLLAQGDQMAEPSAEQASAQQAPASEIAKAKELRDGGAINEQEFERLKQRALG